MKGREGESILGQLANLNSFINHNLIGTGICMHDKAIDRFPPGFVEDNLFEFHIKLAFMGVSISASRET